jgi:spermidine/putrescine transport system substrate-binding protein
VPHTPHPNSFDRRTFLRRAAMAGIALPSLSAILAACGGGAQSTVGGATSAAGTGSAAANPYGTGGIAGAVYPLARQEAPVTWNVDPAQLIESDLEPEKGATLKILRWPFYIDPGLLRSFEKEYDCTVEDTEFGDMDKGLAKIQSGQGDFDMLIGMNVWAIGRSIAAGLLRPMNHDYIPNLAGNVWDQFQSPFYDVGANYTLPYGLWNTGIFWRNDKLDIDPASMDNPYDVFFDNPPAGKTHLLANAQDVLAMPMFRDGLTDVNVDDPALIDKAKQDIATIAQLVGEGLSFDHVDYTDVPAGDALLHQSWSGNASDAVVFLEDKSEADVLSYYWPGSDGHPANVDNDVIVLLNTGKTPVLAHLLANWVLDADNALANFVNMTGYQMGVKSMTRQTMVSSGIVPDHLATVIVTEDDFTKGSRELELATDTDALWQQAFAELQAGV